MGIYKYIFKLLIFFFWLEFAFYFLLFARVCDIIVFIPLVSCITCFQALIDPSQSVHVSLIGSLNSYLSKSPAEKDILGKKGDVTDL